LKIPKGSSESVNQRRTDHTMAKRKTIYDKWNISVVICDTDIP